MTRLIVLAICTIFLLSLPAITDEVDEEPVIIPVLIRMQLEAPPKFVTRHGSRFGSIVAKELDKNDMKVMFRPYSLPGEYEVYINISVYEKEDDSYAAAVITWRTCYKNRKNRHIAFYESEEDRIEGMPATIPSKLISYFKKNTPLMAKALHGADEERRAGESKMWERRLLKKFRNVGIN